VLFASFAHTKQATMTDADIAEVAQGSGAVDLAAVVAMAGREAMSA
jgi:hypothetical protein